MYTEEPIGSLMFISFLEIIKKKFEVYKFLKQFYHILLIFFIKYMIVKF